MSKLDEALGGTRFVKVSEYSSQINDMGIDRTQLKNTKQEIKALMLELIGEDVEVTRIDRKTGDSEHIGAQNDLRYELRQKVEAL